MRTSTGCFQFFLTSFFAVSTSAFLILIAVLTAGPGVLEAAATPTRSACEPLTPKQFQKAEQAARRWAPLIWLAPGERFFPSSALEFLSNTQLRGAVEVSELPIGPESRGFFLETKVDIETLLQNSSSWLHGRAPSTVPVYAVVSSCCPRKPSLPLPAPRHLSSSPLIHPLQSLQFPPEHNQVIKPALQQPWPPPPSEDEDESRDFEVTYWFFFPYNEGKSVCTVSGGLLGPLPFPFLRTGCLGSVKKYGGHVGDWEHVTIAFKGSGEPTAMYVSTHDAGALYLAPTQGLVSTPPGGAAPKDGLPQFWPYSGHELRRDGRLLSPEFPRKAAVLPTGRPVLFVAKGSHGLWTMPGDHKYVSFPRLADETGFGTAWHTWHNLQVLSWPLKPSEPRWLRFEGRWGNPSEGCSPLAKFMCQLTQGPQGIPAKDHTFRCLHSLPQVAKNLKKHEKKTKLNLNVI